MVDGRFVETKITQLESNFWSTVHIGRELTAALANAHKFGESGTHSYQTLNVKRNLAGSPSP